MTTTKFNKSSGEKFHAELKNAKLATNTDLANFEQYAIENNRKITNI